MLKKLDGYSYFNEYRNEIQERMFISDAIWDPVDYINLSWEMGKNLPMVADCFDAKADYWFGEYVYKGNDGRK